MSGLLRRILPPIVVTALLVVLGVVVWPMVFEPYEEVVPGPPSLAARQNPFLALERVLAATGEGVRRQSGLQFAPDAPRTVLLFPDSLQATRAGAEREHAVGDHEDQRAPRAA